LTAMKNGVYVLLAVVAGVTLVGLLPGQLSNLAVPTVELASLQGSKEAAGNTTLSSGAPSRGNGGANSTYEDTTSAAADAQAKSDASEGAIFVLGEVAYDPFADIMYYGMWGVGLIVSLSIYFVAKRTLG
jgi:hypothetical protein